MWLQVKEKKCRGGSAAQDLWNAASEASDSAPASGMSPCKTGLKADDHVSSMEMTSPRESAKQRCHLKPLCCSRKMPGWSASHSRWAKTEDCAAHDFPGNRLQGRRLVGLWLGSQRNYSQAARAQCVCGGVFRKAKAIKVNPRL